MCACCAPKCARCAVKWWSSAGRRERRTGTQEPASTAPGSVVAAGPVSTAIAMALATLVPMITAIFAPTVMRILVGAVAIVTVRRRWPIGWRRAARRLFHKIHWLIACGVARAVTAPVFCMARRHVEIDRRARQQHGRAMDDHRLRIDHRRWRPVADIDAAIDARRQFAADGRVDVSLRVGTMGHCQSRQGQSAGPRRAPQKSKLHDVPPKKVMAAVWSKPGAGPSTTAHKGRNFVCPQPSKRAKVSKASNSSQTTTERHTKPTTLRK